MVNPDILIYTDGSSRGNPGPGGYGIIIQKFSCVICHNEKICKNTEITKSYICNSCELKEEREREIKYQSFTFTGYK